MFFTLTLSLFEKALNAALGTDVTTQHMLAQKLNQKTVRVQLNSPAVCVDMLIDQQKIRLSVPPQESASNPHLAADCTLHCDNLVALLSLISTENVGGNVPVTGDSKVLIQLKDIIEQTQINMGLLVQPFLGASVAGQIQQAFSGLSSQAKKSTQQAQFYGEEWLKEDNDLLAKRWQMQQFQEQVRDLRTETDRLAARIAAAEAVFSV